MHIPNTTIENECETSGRIFMPLISRYNLNLLGIDFKHIPAVDGKTLNQEYIDKNKIQVKFPSKGVNK